jgi:hypothetical protein
MHKILCLNFIIISLFGCSTQKPEPKVSMADSTSVQETPKSGSVTIRNMDRFPDIKNQNNLNKIIRELETADCVDENGVGFAAEYTRTYALYERMGQLATEQQLFGLLKNKSAVVRVYAFRALAAMKYSSANAGKSILDSDTNHVCWFVGCVKTDTTVSFFSRSEE